MFEICISGFLVISATLSILLWPALVAAKRADAPLQRINEAYNFESTEEKTQLTRLIASARE
ncbi:MAG TPA: hypothetical protein VGK56_13995 [Anaerolineales bacterium]